MHLGSRSRPRATAVVSLLFVLLVSGVARGAEPEFRCVVDRVEGLFTTEGYVVLRGWAADTSEDAPVKKVEAFLDGARPGDAQWGDWRSDVMAHFARPDFAWTGWSATFSLEDVLPGPHSVEAYATSHAGRKVSCGRKPIEVHAIAPPPERTAWRIGAEILLRSAGFLLWLGFVGFLPALLSGIRPAPLAAPLLGLCLLAIVGAAGAALHVRPIWSAAFLTFVVAIACPFVLRIRRPGAGRPRVSRLTLATLGAAVLFALVGVVPLASHGEGAVLGDIDDGVRVCAAADSMVRFGWTTPAEHRGYLSVMRGQMERAKGRRGETELMAALAQVFGERAHAVHSVAMIGAGCLVVLGTGLLAYQVLRRFRRLRAVAPFLVAVNSVLLATLYGQHLGSLVAAALFLLFLASLLTLARSRLFASSLPVALAVAAAWSLYPEALPAWAVAAAISLALPTSAAARKRMAARVGAALLAAVVLNPVGFVLVVRSWTGLSGEPAFATSYGRMVVGDTHYFPAPNVIAGIVAYRQDAPAPLGTVRSVLVPVATALLLVVSVLGWTRLTPGERKVLLVLLVPLALGFAANRHLDFPYGFAKFLPLAAPVWAVAFVLLASAAEQARKRKTASLVVAYGTLALVALLSLPSARHVVHRAQLRVPSYDAAFRVLPALADAVGPEAVFRIEDYPGSRKLWAIYFLGDNAVDLTPTANGFPGAPYFRIHDRRTSGEPAAGAVVSTRYFSLVPIPGEPGS